MTDYPFYKRQQLIWDLDCSPTQKMFLLAVNQFVGENSCCWPSISKLERMTGFNRRTISRCSEQLEKLSIITRKERFADGKQTTNEYKINWENMENRDDTRSPSHDRGSSPPCHTITPPMTEDHTELSKLTIQSNSSPLPPKEKDEIDRVEKGFSVSRFEDRFVKLDQPWRISNAINGFDDGFICWLQTQWKNETPANAKAFLRKASRDFDQNQNALGYWDDYKTDRNIGEESNADLIRKTLELNGVAV